MTDRDAIEREAEAMVVGWGADRVALIRARYVDRGRVARAMAQRFSA